MIIRKSIVIDFDVTKMPFHKRNTCEGASQDDIVIYYVNKAVKEELIDENTIVNITEQKQNTKINISIWYKKLVP